MNIFFYILLLVISTAIALPTPYEESRPAEPKQVESFGVQIDRLAQLIATHIQFDHLDAVISNTDQEIATQFQHHIQVHVQPKTSKEQQVMTVQPTLDMMDLEILQSQISAAIQAHTEGSLPLTWDRLAEGLSRQAIESHIRQLLMDFCPPKNDIIESICLDKNAVDLASKLEDYIIAHLGQVFQALDKNALPDLLQHTAQDLEGILTYFNSIFLSNENQQFVLQVLPWKSDSHNFVSRLLEIASRRDGSEDKTHSTSFFIEFAAMARV